MRTNKLEELESYFTKFPDVPKEVIIKEDLLRLGLSFTENALKAAEGSRFKSYRLFTYDKVKHDDVATEGILRIPEDFQYKGGPYNLRRTVLCVRLSTTSPYVVDVVDGKVVINAEGSLLAEVKYPPRPDYYAKVFDDGAMYSEVGPIEGDGAVFFTAYRVCQFFGSKLECQFCDINYNTKQAKQYGKAYMGSKAFKDVDQVAEVAYEVLTREKNYGDVKPAFCLITGGAILGKLNGKTEEEFYLDYVRALKNKLENRWPIILQTTAREKEDYKRFRAAGVDAVHSNIEVWGKDLFKAICPGKEKYVGWDNWIRRVIESVDVFGEGNVTPNLIPGVEMAQPYGFKDVASALKSTIGGLEYLMSHGVIVRFNQWNISAFSALADNPPVPLEYFIRLDQAWCEIWAKYNLPLLRGVGARMGPGISNWHMSAVLDMDAGLCYERSLKTSQDLTEGV